VDFLLDQGRTDGNLDLGAWAVKVEATLRRLSCPTHGVVVEAVPFACLGAHLTRDLNDLVAWLATRMDKTSITRLCRVSWRTVGRACQRVVDPGRLDGLFRVGVDEISWRRHHKYLTLVVDHDRRQGHPVGPDGRMSPRGPTPREPRRMHPGQTPRPGSSAQ